MPETGFRELGISDAALLSYHSGTTTPCLSLSVPVPLEELNSYRRAVLSPCVPPCRPLSMKENDYEQRRSQVRVLPSALRESRDLRTRRTRVAVRRATHGTLAHVLEARGPRPAAPPSSLGRAPPVGCPG